MGMRTAWRWQVFMGGLMQFPFMQYTCDLCAADTVKGETEACKKCRAELHAVIEQIQAASGIRFTPDMVRSIGRGPRPPQFRYGKPWHRHIPPREREKLGLHT